MASSLSTTNDSDRTPSLYVGDKAHLLCAYEEPIIKCEFVIPGVAYEIELSSSTPPLTTRSGYKFSYYGRGLNHGDCGVTIHNLTFFNQGQAMCTIITTNAEEMMENLNIRIKNATAWSLPKITLLNNDKPLKVGQTLMAECIVKSYDEFANLSWHLNNEILTNDSSVQETLKSQSTDGVGNFFYEIKSSLKHELRDVDNGKTLKCKINNFLRNSTSEVDHLLILEKAVPKIGEPYDIVINFTAFPRPSSPKWKVSERNIYYGKSNNEFISRELQYLGNNQWKAILHIANVTEQNFRLNYSLKVNDALGSKSYDVRLDDFDNNNKQLLNYNTAVVDEDLTSSTKVINLDNERNSILYSPPSLRPTSLSVKPSTYRRRGTTIDNRIDEKSQQNNTMTIFKMTSVTVTTTQASIDTTNSMSTEASVDTTVMPTKETLYNEIEIISSEDSNETNVKISLDAKRNESQEQNGSIFVASAFILMLIALIVLFAVLCHYRMQVVILKREIIQLSTENFYNSQSYPGLYNIANLSQDLRQNALMNFPVNSIEIKNEYCIPDYSNSGSEATNSHLYQSIDEANHVYDEIISNKSDRDGEKRNYDGNEKGKPNNYENNESMNCELL